MNRVERFPRAVASEPVGRTRLPTLGEIGLDHFVPYLLNRITQRWNADPEDVQKSVARLVLTLVEFIRQLLERQAIRRMEAGTLEPEETPGGGLTMVVGLAAAPGKRSL